jgi:hypothetical protein
MDAAPSRTYKIRSVKRFTKKCKELVRSRE